MATPATLPLSDREREILAFAQRVLDALEPRKPMGTAPEPEPCHDARRLQLIERSA